MTLRLTILLCAGLLNSMPILNAQGRYYKTETHCHSINSGDGYIAPAELLQQYKNRDYEIVFLSDHDTLTDAESLNFPGILSINAEELSCGSHFNGFNMTRGVDACGMSNQQKVDSILAQGALVCINHPVAPRWRITAEEILALEGELSFIEIYNPSDIYEAHDDQSLWDSLLTADRKIWGIASGDVHQFYPLESVWLGWTMIRLETLSKEAVLDAMLRGDFYASTGVEISDYEVSGDTVSVSCNNCVKIIFWGKDHTKLKQVNKQTASYTRQPGDKYVRAELVFDRNNKAWTQPVFFDTPTAISVQESIQITDIFPNPSNGRFTLSYLLKETTKLDIALYDLQGRLVKQLPGGSKTAGWHKLETDISELPAGTYLLKLTGEGFSVAKRVVVFL